MWNIVLKWCIGSGCRFRNYWYYYYYYVCCYVATQLARQSSNRENRRLENLQILVQHQSFGNIVGAWPTVAPRNSGRDNAAGIMIIWWTSPPRILQIHSLKLPRSPLFMFLFAPQKNDHHSSFPRFWNKLYSPYNWDSAPRNVCSSNFTSDLCLFVCLGFDDPSNQWTKRITNIRLAT